MQQRSKTIVYLLFCVLVRAASLLGCPVQKMAAATETTISLASSSQLYQQALALLQQKQFHNAFVAAKRALDSAGGAAQAPMPKASRGGRSLSIAVSSSAAATGQHPLCAASVSLAPYARTSCSALVHYARAKTMPSQLLSASMQLRGICCFALFFVRAPLILSIQPVSGDMGQSW